MESDVEAWIMDGGLLVSKTCIYNNGYAVFNDINVYIVSSQCPRSASSPCSSIYLCHVPMCKITSRSLLSIRIFHTQHLNFHLQGRRAIVQPNTTRILQKDFESIHK